MFGCETGGGIVDKIGTVLGWSTCWGTLVGVVGVVAGSTVDGVSAGTAPGRPVRVDWFAPRAGIAQ